MVPKTLILLSVCGASLCFQQCLAATPLFDYERPMLTVDDFAGIPTEYASLFAFNTTGPVIGRGACKVSPGDAAWPSQDEWDALNKMVGGALIKTTPIGAHCYYDWGMYDAEKCKALVKDWTVPYTHMNDPTSVMWPLYEGASCIPTVDAANSSCSLGGYPAYVVNVTTVAQIQAAVNFARNKGLRVVIKNTGHDYLGKSSGAGALSIWTHHLQRLDYIDNLEIGHFKGKAIHAGSGVRGLDVSRTAYENGASAVGGMCASVGFAGGFFSGGGLSPLSSVFGMAADHILSIGVVTADGNFVVATEESHSELFWAIRGGGGSTWGVVTSVSVRLLPSVPLTSIWFEFQTSEAVSKDTFWKGVQACFENFEPFTESGFYGFVNIRRNYSSYNSSDYSFALEPLMAPNSSIELVKEATKPLFDRLTELGIPFTQELKHYNTFFDGWTATWPDNELYVAGPMAVEGTRFFPANTLISQNGLNAIRKASELGFDISGVNTSPRNPFNVDNAINPALRDAVVFLGSGISFPRNATAQQKSAAQEKLMANLLVPWREVAPASKMGGSYLNEANPMELHWQEDFYGSNYPRLSNVKRQYDPHGVFYATTGVGSEDWEVRTKDQGIQTQNGPLCRI